MPDRSGAARKARGLRRLEAWLSERTIERLRELAEEAGDSVPEHLTALIDQEWEQTRSTVR